MGIEKFLNQKEAFIIAELSANHNHDYDLAIKTIKAMADAGADAVKIQTYTPDSLVMDVDNEFFGPIRGGLWDGIKRYDLYKQGMLPYEWQPKLKAFAEKLGLLFFSTPFDRAGVDFLDQMNIPLYKIASFEINDVPLIRYIAKKKKPIILSTGVGDEEDIALALKVCREEGNNDISLLKCTSDYPASYEKANLQTIPDMKNRFGVRVGVSDHSMGSLVPMVAVALGATIVEKHFILSRSVGGPDAAFSMEPYEFKQMVQNVRNVEKVLGNVKYDISETERRKRRSLYAFHDIKKGEAFTEKNVRSFRPGFGLSPKYYDVVMTKISRRDFQRGDILTEDDIR
ncbi:MULTISPECIES: pseudaminic acid synthase [Butyricimonas]|uniref:pseudaminic acid synthase n=1 Tax=Butyricimonas TaxID=574697 RepID=UPI00207FDD48|nr:pseudaminic acid synthase [Butyricimonas paravirosa]BDF55659.1 N-acetylneuraminic acid synthase [Odoribacteraceae bacterium]GKH94524.1 N-acetylneuraminic acid synthase [Odoribacteraceae bacterium]GKI00562.1 N-acetylneuraminic acid synthase [Odoribacteraceae bacterium]GKI02058.1 N-acetylneuraminic acid synthase [Odoribacteraceae bacterium]